MGFRLNIKGQLNSIHLAEAKALWPLFEAVVNSIQSIEDSPNKTCGKIEIYAQREGKFGLMTESRIRTSRWKNLSLLQLQIMDWALIQRTMSPSKQHIRCIRYRKAARALVDFFG